MEIRIVDFKSFKDAINKFDELATSDNNKNFTIDFSLRKDISKRMEKFFEIADGNPEWNV